MRSASHPEQAVRHSYPLAVSESGFGSSSVLLLKTLPYALARFGVLLAVSVGTVLWYVLTFGGAAFIAERVPLLAYGWMLFGVGAWGYAYWFLVRYFLYLLKSGHIAVLTELITYGQIQNGQEGMFQYGKRVVKERFGEVNAMFALDAIVKAVVGVFNGTLNWVANLLPIPGLRSVTQLVSTVVRAATSYIDETLFSYSLARGDENKWRSAQDGLVYYAQNHEAILKTSIWIVLLDWALTGVLWFVCLGFAGALAWMLPPGGLGQFGVLLLAVLVGANLRSAFLKPLFLVMIMTKFHVSIQNQPINLEWDARLSSVSAKFRELKAQVAGAPAAPTTAGLPAASMR